MSESTLTQRAAGGQAKSPNSEPEPSSLQSTHADIPLIEDDPLYEPHVQSRHSYASSKNKESILANFRLVMENFFRYGLIINAKDLFFSFAHDYERWPGLLISLSTLPYDSPISLGLLGYVVVALGAENLWKMGVLSRNLTLLVHIVNGIAIIVVPWIQVVRYQPFFGAVIMVSILASTVWLKLYSYAHTNYVLKERFSLEKKTHSESEEAFKKKWLADMSSVTNMALFMVLPTLCYQVYYPRTESINWRRFFQRVGVFVLLGALTYVIAHQYIYPAVKNSIIHIDEQNYARIVERVLKTAVPNLYVWLLGFFCFFEVYLNIVAEVTRFADRRFYNDWWNSESLGYYWRTWNLPVHNWVKRHVYSPLIAKKYNKWVASFLAFFVSAFFHEYILSMPFGTVKLWAFFGILGQMPLVVLTEQLKGHHYLGNVIFWLSITLGQPLLVFMYYRAYLAQFE